jgi:hypothetical protein
MRCGGAGDSLLVFSATGELRVNLADAKTYYGTYMSLSEFKSSRRLISTLVVCVGSLSQSCTLRILLHPLISHEFYWMELWVATCFLAEVTSSARDALISYCHCDDLGMTIYVVHDLNGFFGKGSNRLGCGVCLRWLWWFLDIE